MVLGVMCLIHTVKLFGSFKFELVLFKHVVFDVHIEDLPLLDERLIHSHFYSLFGFDVRHHADLINLCLRMH